MNTRPVKPKEYFIKFLSIPEDKIDYSEIPATTASDWEDAEVLFPVTPEEISGDQVFHQPSKAPAGRPRRRSS